jgi:pyruvate/2-oxoglutarate/acetoin dehydrogenase E1 component
MGDDVNYFGELTKAMTMLAEQGALFLGQSIVYDGQRMHASFKDVPAAQKIEMPIVEDFQMGFCTGLSLAGHLPVCVYPRMDFMLLAANQLVNHLDKLPEFGYRPRVIIRTAVGSTSPMNPGPQHCQNHIEAFRLMLKNIMVLDIQDADDVQPAYGFAMQHQGSVVLVEHTERY